MKTANQLKKALTGMTMYQAEYYILNTSGLTVTKGLDMPFTKNFSVSGHKEICTLSITHRTPGIDQVNATMCFL